MEKIAFLDPETGLEEEFAVEEETQLNGEKYLLVSDGEENGDSEAFILKEVRTEGGETVYDIVEDEVEFSAIAKVFAELFDEDTEVLY